MSHSLRPRNLVLPLAALALAAAATTSSALFEAPNPGAGLSPLSGAEEIVEILQVNGTVLWTSLSGPITSYRAEGWSETIDGNDLGGALVIERTSAESGVVEFGDRPRSVSFQFGP